MSEHRLHPVDPVDPNSPIFSEAAFQRSDDGDDSNFYAKDRFVSHLDRTALETVEKLIGGLIIEERPVILDLMAGWDSHLPRSLQPGKVVGLGLNRKELEKNKALSEAVIQDLNGTPSLPFPDGTFDAVVNTVSVDYMTQPLEVFKEVGRVLKPGGLFLVIFSNRMFPEKAVKIWKEASEEERVIFVEEFFRFSGLFENPSFFVSKGKPRPPEDKYAHLGIPSDPVYAVYADRKTKSPSKTKRPVVSITYGEPMDREELGRRKKAIKDSLRCPYCEKKLKKWAVPHNPFANTWDNEYMYICFNDACPYYVRGWDKMSSQGNRGSSYRLMYNPDKDSTLPNPVPTPKALRDGIVE